MLTGQFCHGYARGPWIAVAWWALYWNGPIRQTFLMVSCQIPTLNDARKKSYLCCEKLLANIGTLSSNLLFSSESSSQAWPEYFCRFFWHPRPPKAFSILFRTQTSNVHRAVVVVFASESFAKTSVVHGLLFFRAKTLVIRGMSFAGFARKPHLFRNKLFAVLVSEKTCLIFDPFSFFFFSCVLYISLSLLSRSPWLGTPLVRTSMETGGQFSPLTPWRKQTPCVHELVSWSKVNLSELLFWIS